MRKPQPAFYELACERLAVAPDRMVYLDDLGINLKDEQATERLEKAGSFNAMVSHRVRLEKPGDVDKDVKVWLKKAYSEA